VFSEAIEAEGAIVFKKACELDVEGIVSKRQARKPHVDGLAADPLSQTIVEGLEDA